MQTPHPHPPAESLATLMASLEQAVMSRGGCALILLLLGEIIGLLCEMKQGFAQLPAGSSAGAARIVAQPHGGNPTPLRRKPGWMPEPIPQSVRHRSPPGRPRRRRPGLQLPPVIAAPAKPRLPPSANRLGRGALPHVLFVTI